MKNSCASCGFSEIKRDIENNKYSENTIFICSLDEKEKHRSQVCRNWKLAKNRMGKIEYCPTCDEDTYSKDWFCSVCWSDRPSSELFDID